MLNYFVAGVALAYATYTDLKNREVPNTLNFFLIFFGLFYFFILAIIYKQPSFFINSLISGLICFIIAYFLWYIGVFAGGDAKLFIGLATTIPKQTYSILNLLNTFSPFFVFSIFISAVLVVFPFGATIALIKIIKEQKLKQYLKKELSKKNIIFLETIISVISAYFVLNYFNLSNWFIIPILFLVGFIPKKVKLPIMLLLFLIAIYINPIQNAKLIIFLFIISYSIWIILKLFFLIKTGLLNKKIKTNELKEGQILAYPIAKKGKKIYFLKSKKKLFFFLKKYKLDGFKKYLEYIKKIKKNIIIDNSSAAGLTEDEVNFIKQHFKGNIEIKLTIPFVPAIFISYLLLLFIGDFIWYFLK